jgi:molybdate transport system ATP-binding protein
LSDRQGRVGHGGPGEAAVSAPRLFLSLEGVSLRAYGRLWFQDTDWTVLEDEHWAIVGPNGAGKSTLVRAICGRVPVVRGRIRYHWHIDASHGRPQEQVAGVSLDSLRQVLGREGGYYQARWNSGVGGQGTSVSEYLSERQVKALNPFQVIQEPSAAGQFAARRRETVALLGIGDLMGRRMVELSDGERRKVEIARALLKDPRLLILDNPFTGLDARFRDSLAAVIAGLMQGRMRVWVVASRVDDVPPGITHALLVREGQVVARGPCETILTHAAAQEARQPALLPLPAGGARKGHPCDHARRPLRAAPGEVLVDMRDVHVSLDGTSILRGVNWTIREGEHWALLGPNGAGKTTLLSMILGDLPQAYANHISLFGRRRGSGESIWEIKQQIGWVAPELHLYHPQTASCLDVICSGFFDSVGLYRACSPAQRDTARAWMERLGLDGTGQTFGALSEGEQRLALIARALVKGPRLLILDEPCQGLDVRNSARVLEAVDAATERMETSLVYVTHRADEMPRAITHVLRLDGGVVVDSGPWDRDLDEPGRNQAA